MGRRVATMSDAVTFAECLRNCVSNTALVREYDRLRGTNLSFTGSQMDLAIDRACRRQEQEFEAFTAFVFEYIWMPVAIREATND